MAGRVGKKGAANSASKPLIKKRGVAKAVSSLAVNKQPEAKKISSRSVGKTTPLKKPGTGKHVHELQVRQAELESQNEDLRRAQGLLQASQERYFDLYDIAPVGYFSISAKGIILEVNITGANMLGAIPSDMRAQRFDNFIYAEDQAIYYQHRSQLFETRLPQACEMRMVHKDGSLVWVLVEAIVAKDSRSGKAVCLATMNDITRQKKLDEELRNERNLAQNYLDTVQTIIVALDTEGKITTINRKGCQLFGLSEDKLIGQLWFSTCLPQPDGIEKVYPVFLKLIAGELEAVEYFENPVVTRSGEIRQIAWHNALLRDDKGLVTGTLSSGNDITEHKNMEEALQHSEALYRLLAEHTTETVWLMDSNLKIIYHSPSAEKLRGFTSQEIVELPLERHVTPGSLKLLAGVLFEELPRVEANTDYNPVRTLEVEMFCKDGTTTWREIKLSVIRDPGGKPASFLGEARDITDRRKAEEALKASEAQYRLLADNTADGIWLLDMDLKLIYCSPSSEKQSGFTLQEIMEMSLDQYFTPESLKIVSEVFLEEIPKVQADPDYNPTLTVDLEFYKKDGTAFWAESKFSIIRDNSGKPVSILAVARDITERKVNEAALRESEERYRSLVETAIAGIASIDIEGKFMFANDTVCLWSGLNKADILGRPFADFLHPDDLPGLMEMFLNTAASGSPGPTIEFRIIRRDGQVIWLHTIPTPIILDGETVGFNTILHNVTDRKLAEEALRQSEVKYRTVLEQMDEAYYEVDLAGNLTFFNDATCRQLGYSAEELTGMNYRVYTSKDDLRREYEIFNLVYRTGKPNTGFPICRIRKDGGLVFTENSALPLRNKDGKIIGFRGVARDITGRIHAEQALRESEAQYRLLSEHTTDTVWLMDMDLNFIYQSPSVEKLRGFTAQEIMEIPWQQHVTPESQKLVSEVILREIPRVLAEPDYNPILALELEYTCKDGTTVWAESKCSIIRDESGKPVSILGEARDITERRKSDELLRKSEAQYRLLSEHMTDTIRLMDLDLKTTYLSPSAEKMRGFTHQEMLELPLEKQLTPESLRLAAGIFSEELSRVKTDPDYNPIHTLDLEYLCKDGTTIWAESKFSVVRDENGNPVSILAEARDITERRLAEEELNIQNSLLSAVVNSPEDIIIFSVNKEYCYTAFNEKHRIEMRKVWNVNIEVGMNLLDCMTIPELREIAKQSIDRALTGVHFMEEQHQADKGIFYEFDWNTVRLKNKSIIGATCFIRDITERKLAEDKLAKSYESLKKTLNDAINTMVKIVELRDPYTAGHQQKVADLATAIARTMKLEDSRIDQLRMASVTHDIGKMYVPSDILSKPGKLSTIEFSLIKTHSQSGYNIVKGMDFPSSVADTILQHHERLDGSGYPRGLKSEDMLLEAKILAVADVVEAMASHRPYRSALGIGKALDEISNNRGKLYDPDVVDACLELFRNGQFEFKSV